MRRFFHHPPPALVAISIAIGMLCARQAAAEESGVFRRAVMIRVDGMIDPMLRAYLERKLDEARQREADLVILQVTSPGGMVDESERLARAMQEIDWARTATYVPRQALSGATILALGCDDIVMRPQAKLGDAGPIFLDEDFMFRHAPEKFRSDLVRTVRDLAEAGDRPPALAEAMVDTEAVVYRYKNIRNGETRYMTPADVAGRDDADQWQRGPLVPESRKGLFLEVNGRRAVELGLADAVVEDVAGLKQRYGIDGELPVLRRSSLDTVVFVLNIPFVTWLIFVVGLVALYIEFSAPGIGVGGLVAGLCFALFFWSRFLGGTAGWLELVLFLVGVAFLLIELLVLPGFGVAGIAGILLLVVALLLAGQAAGVPDTRPEMIRFANSVFVMAAAGVTVAIVAYFLRKYFGLIPLARQLMLAPPVASGGSATAVLGASGAATTTDDGGESVRHAAPDRLEVGQRGIAHTPLRPAGRGRFGDRFVNVVTDSEFVARGQPIEIVETGGSQFVVRPV